MTEIELKLEISPTDRKALLKSGILGEQASSVRQHSRYFDTKDGTLFFNNFTLRIRRSGDARVQTVKATGPSASLFARSEWETPVTGELPVLDDTSPLGSQFALNNGDLSPQFEVSIERRSSRVNENGSQIEAAFDEGVVTAGGRHAPICEIELELKDGNARDLFVLARKLEAVVPVKFGAQSKAERGYWLMEALRSTVKADQLELDGSMPAVESFQAIAQSCFRHFRLNEAILLRERNADALHQSRVAIRRLRSSFSLFKPLSGDGEAERLTNEFRWLAGVLGKARNLDVLLLKAQGRDLHDHLVAAREHAYDEVFDALGSFRARALMLDFNEWLQCGDQSTSKEAQQQTPADKFASIALDKIRKKLKKHGDDLAGIDDEHRHQVRKDAKKLRYAAEFFGSIFADKRGARRHKRFIAAMEGLQDQLGALNDLATGPSVLEKHGLRAHPEADALLSHANKSSLIGKAQSALDDVLDAKRFWR